MIPGQMMRVCRECPDNRLPECGKGKCAKRDAALEEGRAKRAALRKDKADNAVYLQVAMRNGMRKAGQR